MNSMISNEEDRDIRVAQQCESNKINFLLPRFLSEESEVIHIPRSATQCIIENYIVVPSIIIEIIDILRDDRAEDPVPLGG